MHGGLSRDFGRDMGAGCLGFHTEPCWEPTLFDSLGLIERRKEGEGEEGGEGEGEGNREEERKRDKERYAKRKEE